MVTTSSNHWGRGEVFCAQELGALNSGIWIVWLCLFCLYKRGKMNV